MKKITKREFLKRFKKTHGNMYDYSKSNFISANKKISIICPIHGEFYQTPKNHFLGQGCKFCGYKKISESNKLSTEDFIDKSKKIHKNKYNYQYVKYVNARIKVKINCKIHGIFEQSPSHHLCGRGCPKCKNEKISKSRRLSTKLIVDTCRRIHGEKYKYLSINYFSGRGKMSVLCPIHGVFEQDLHNHLRGCGCPNCAGCLKSNIKEFIEKAKKIHGDKYNYSKFNYVNAKTKGIIICPIHGEFYQIPNNHLCGNGCNRCVTISSKPESKFLDFIGIPIKNRQHHIGRYKIDGVDFNKNIIYEFFGDFWHGNPKIYNAEEKHRVSQKTYGVLYKETMQKLKYLKKIGYTIKYIWESDWENFKNGIDKKPNIIEFI